MDNKTKMPTVASEKKSLARTLCSLQFSTFVQIFLSSIPKTASGVELKTNLCKDFTITEKAPTRAYNWTKVPTSAFTFVQGVPQLSSHFVLVVCCASHASPIIKWSIYFFSWIKIYAKNGITLKN